MPAELREALDAAVTQAESQAAAEPVTSTTETTDDNHAQPNGDEGSIQKAPTSSEGQVHGAEDGTAKPAGADDANKAAKPVDGAGTDADRKDDDEQADRQKDSGHRVDRAPASWRKEAKGEWGALPLGVRQEVHRREQQINQVLTETQPMREAVETFNKMVSPYMARIQQNGVTPMQAIHSLLDTESRLANSHPRDAAQLMAQLITQYRIDVGALDEALAAMQGGQPRQAAPAQSDVVTQIKQSLMQELAPVLNSVRGMQEQQQAQSAQIAAEANDTVEAMSLDPNFPQFEEVREIMADLMEASAKRGVYMSLEDAYSRVTGQATQRRDTALSAHQRAQAAKAAASSVQSNPGHSGGTVPNTDGSLRGAIEAAFGGSRI